VENEGGVVCTQPVVIGPVTALANAIQVSNILVKTEDGGSPQSANTTGRDAFTVYSNANIMRRAALLNRAADAEEGEGRGDAIPVANRPTGRKTRLSLEVHPDLFFQDLMFMQADDIE